MTWSKGWTGKVTLSQEGSEIDVSKAQELASLPATTRLDHGYYFLNVGTGGVRRDRSFVFVPMEPSRMRASASSQAISPPAT